MIRQISGTLLFPDTPGYDRARAVWNLRVDRHPQAIVVPRDASEVAAVVAWAGSYRQPLHLRSGGLCYEGFSVGEGVVLDTRALGTWEVESATGRVKAPPGLRLGEFQRRLERHGLAFPVGTCSAVGLAGYTLGGGYGVSSRCHGLAADRLVRLEAVDAGARRLTLDERNHPELFWACRGAGGGSFAVVTSLEFELPAAPPTVTLYRLAWRPEEFAEALEAWQTRALSCSDGLTPRLLLSPGRMVCRGLFLGNATGFRSALRPLLSVGTPEVFASEMTFGSAARRLMIAVSSGLSESKSHLLDSPLPRAGLEELWERSRAAPGRWAVVFEPLGGAIARVPLEATAFPHRQAALLMMMAVRWSAPRDEERCLGWIRQTHQALSVFATGGCYRNYADSDLPDPGAAYYGVHRLRLAELKRRLDPQSLFARAEML